MSHVARGIKGSCPRVIALIAKHHALIIEGTAAAPLAALLHYHDDFADKRVVLVVSGRNLDVDTLAMNASLML